MHNESLLETVLLCFHSCVQIQNRITLHLKGMPAFMVGLWVSEAERGMWDYLRGLCLASLPNSVALRGIMPVFDPISQHLALRRS